jgi:hypothetical protein
MDFFMIHLRNVNNAFENFIVVICLLFSYKRKETLEEYEEEKTHNTLNDSTVSDLKFEKLIDQESRDETDNTKITYHKQPKKTHLEIINTSLHVINNVINENAKDKIAPDPLLNIDFNSIENRGAEEKYYYGTIKDRMFNYRATLDFWESISQLKK